MEREKEVCNTIYHWTIELIGEHIYDLMEYGGPQSDVSPEVADHCYVALQKRKDVVTVANGNRSYDKGKQCRMFG